MAVDVCTVDEENKKKNEKGIGPYHFILSSFFR